MGQIGPKWTNPGLFQIRSEKVPDLSHLGPIWPTLEANLPSLMCIPTHDADHETTCRDHETACLKMDIAATRGQHTDKIGQQQETRTVVFSRFSDCFTNNPGRAWCLHTHKQQTTAQLACSSLFPTLPAFVSFYFFDIGNITPSAAFSIAPQLVVLWRRIMFFCSRRGDKRRKLALLNKIRIKKEFWND